MTDHDPDRCTRCGHPLSTPLSRAAGYGPTCALHALTHHHPADDHPEAPMPEQKRGPACPHPPAEVAGCRARTASLATLRPAGQH